MRIAAGSDHAGLDLKLLLVEHLRKLGHEVEDLGTHSAESCDYPDYAAAVARAVQAGDADQGLLVCGTGVGMAIAANKLPGVRAAVVSDTFSAHATRQHNDANVLCLGQRVVGPGLALDILDAWLAARFEGGRHQRRVDKIEALARHGDTG
ncbi:MAG: ribose 5-phosphate isomerase B [Deltaproteobacteria bacterium]|nr:MAG: ribose 5-phosphate isomerase B [Deltaproteobacteria bacterium]